MGEDTCEDPKCFVNGICHLRFKMDNGLVFMKTQPWTYYKYLVFQTISKFLSIQCNKGY
jgi:hypothetical protein